MQLVAPDILIEARGLPVGVCASAFALGLALWTLGWWRHRFWIVLCTTLLAGTFGLAAGPSSGLQPMVAAVFLAIAAGALALPLSRLLAFAAGGLALWIAVHAALPAWDEPLLCFLVGGLLGLVLFRHSTMLVTSLAGTLLMAYSSLCLIDRLGKLDAVVWSGKQTLLLNWVCVGLTGAGWVIQLVIDRWQRRRQQAKEEEVAQLRAKAEEAKKKEKEKEKERKNSRRPPTLWEQLGFPKKAG
jgi:hypothetical protein